MSDLCTTHGKPKTQFLYTVLEAKAYTADATITLGPESLINEGCIDCLPENVRKHVLPMWEEAGLV